MKAAVVLLCAVPVLGWDVAKVAFPPPEGRLRLEARTLNGTARSTGRTFIAHHARLGDPRYMSVGILPDGCETLQLTSYTSYKLDCMYAVNAGLFSMDPNVTDKCIGGVVRSGQRMHNSAVDWAVLGLSKSNETVVGFLGYVGETEFDWRELVTGKGWLVREGAQYVNRSGDLRLNSTFVTEKAPRTAVGVDWAGGIHLYQVDGAETIDAGLDLFEFAEVLVDAGLRHAINFDGGGSSVSTYLSTVISRPTCADTPFPICERPVTTNWCVTKAPNV